MTPELYIPPCCIHRQLPDLIRNSVPYGCTFYSQGDWGLEKLWNAVSRLTDTPLPSSAYQYDGDSSPSPTHPIYDGVPTPTSARSAFSALIIPDLQDVYIFRYLRMFFGRGWMSSLLLVTATDCTDLLRSELSDHLDRITYVPNRHEANDINLWVRSSIYATLTIAGPLTADDSGPGHVSAYHASLSHSRNYAIQSLLPFKSIARLHATIRSSDPTISKWI